MMEKAIDVSGCVFSVVINGGRIERNNMLPIEFLGSLFCDSCLLGLLIVAEQGMKAKL